MSKFYTFDQNNSGGSFKINAECGIGYNVVIEANSEEEALKRAEGIIYFDGVSNDMDCECCGDRWSRYCDENEVVPSNLEGYVHYLDGRIEEIND